MRYYTNVFQRGNNLLVRGIDNGVRFKEKVEFLPTLWTTGAIEHSDETWATLDGVQVFPIQPGDIKECKKFVENYSQVSNFGVYESPGNIYQYITQEYKGEIRFTPADISIFTLDIETETENGFPKPDLSNERIILLTVKDTQHAKIITFGAKPFNNTRSDVEYFYCPSEVELLKQFIVWWQQHYPDAITGWNTSQFDNTYLYNRMCKILGETLANKLSPWGVVSQREVEFAGRTSTKTYFCGIANLDYLDLYRKFTYTMQESYKLDHIAFVELGERKVENPGSSFKDFYTNHWDTFVIYNIRDVELVDRLDGKMKLIDLALTLAYAAKINYEDVFSPVKTWDIIIYNYLNERNVVVPPKKVSSKSQVYEGAYVKEPLIGKHHWCCSFDLNSLYPHLIMQYNMSPETITDVKLDTSVTALLAQDIDLSYVHENDLSMAANGWCFRRDKKGLLPTLMQLYYDKRVIYKKEMLAVRQQYENTKDPKLQLEISRLNNLQMAMKILLNSAYGAFGNAYFRYFDIRIAEGITVSGQLSIRWIADALNVYLNKILGTDDVDRIILIDTDSVVLTLDDLVNKVYGAESKVALPPMKIIEFMDKIAEQRIQPFIDRTYQGLADYMNAYEQKMQMKRENLIDVMLSVSKKRYVMSVYNSEGVQYKEPKLKIMGLQIIKSSTPAVVRDTLKASLNAILRGTERDVQKFVAEYRSVFNRLSPEELSFPRTANNIQKFYSSNSIYTKGTPIHVRGSLLYNYYITKMGLDKQYQLIQDGDKVKFTYLKTPNPIHEDCIAFIDKLPPELKLEKYVDYDIMFEKTFIDAVQSMLDTMGWSAEQQATLEDFFV